MELERVGDGVEKSVKQPMRELWVCGGELAGPLSLSGVVFAVISLAAGWKVLWHSG